MALVLPLLVASLLVVAVPVVPSDATLPDWRDATLTKVKGDLAGPMDIAMAPDGSIWFTEVYGGNISRLDPDTGEVEVKFHVDVVGAFDERGLLGLALDPQFSRNGAFYIYYTKPTVDKDGGMNIISRIQDGKETVLLDTITAYKQHNGGRLEFDKEGNLFVGVGDNLKGAPAKDLDSLLGKVLRMTRDGQPVEGNAKGLVYSYGHRNVFGLAVDPVSGKMYETENMGWQRDEINIIEVGKNYGYPDCEGMAKSGTDVPCPATTALPLMTFYERKTAAPTGATFFLGQFLWASWNEGSLHHLWFNVETRQWADKVVHDPPGAIRIGDLETSADGRSLYYSTWTDIWRIDFPSLPPGVERGTMLPGQLEPTTNPTASPPTAPPAAPPAAPPSGPDPRTNGTGANPAPDAGLLLAALALAGAALLGRRLR